MQRQDGAEVLAVFGVALAEIGDLLRLALLEDLEIVLPEAGDRGALPCR